MHHASSCAVVDWKIVRDTARHGIGVRLDYLDSPPDRNVTMSRPLLLTADQTHALISELNRALLELETAAAAPARLARIG
jgi:hypothetical protein